MTEKIGWRTSDFLKRRRQVRPVRKTGKRVHFKHRDSTWTDQKIRVRVVPKSEPAMDERRRLLKRARLVAAERNGTGRQERVEIAAAEAFNHAHRRLTPPHALLHHEPRRVLESARD